MWESPGLGMGLKAGTECTGTGGQHGGMEAGGPWDWGLGRVQSAWVRANGGMEARSVRGRGPSPGISASFL